jgi:hypothetical protein
MVIATVHDTERNGNCVGERVKLARYRITTGERVIEGQRLNGIVRVSDRPAEGHSGRSYLIERGVEQDGYAALKALVADYIALSEHRDQPAIIVDLDRLVDGL